MDQAQLLADIKDNLSESDVRTLLRRLDISPDLLTGYDLQRRIELLFTAAQKADRLSKLAVELVRLRPYLAPKYETVDPLSWIDRTTLDPSQVTPPQITTELKKLRAAAVASGQRKSVQPQRTTQENLAHLQEAPTAVWESPASTTGAEIPSLHHFADKNNPFQAGGRLLESHQFYGRQSVQEYVRSSLQQMHSVAIVGLPGSGKSSLLRQVARQENYKSSWRFLFSTIDLKTPFTGPLPLLQQAVDDWFAALGQQRAPVVNTVADFVRHVRFLAQGGYRPVLCVDNGQHLGQTNGMTAEILEAWETLTGSGRLALLLATSLPIADLGKQAPLGQHLRVQFTETILGELSESEALELLVGKMENRARRMPVEIAQALIDYCGRNPYLLQLGAYHLFPHLRQPQPFSSQVKSLISQKADAYWHLVWDYLTPIQQQLLSKPLQKNAPVVIARQYSKLGQLGILREQGDGDYAISGECGAQWLKSKRV